MTQIIFQVVSIGCCIYTAYGLGLFIYKKLRKNNKTAKAVQVTSYETSGNMKTAREPARSASSVTEEYSDIFPSEYPEKAPYQVTYLINYPLSNRIQVYINRDSYAYIKRFLSVVAPDTSMSGFISRIIDEHLKKHEKEMSALYTECITKPLYGSDTLFPCKDRLRDFYIVAFVVIHFRSKNVRDMGQALSSYAYCPYQVMEIS